MIMLQNLVLFSRLQAWKIWHECSLYLTYTCPCPTIKYLGPTTQISQIKLVSTSLETPEVVEKCNSTTTISYQQEKANSIQNSVLCKMTYSQSTILKLDTAITDQHIMTEILDTCMNILARYIYICIYKLSNVSIIHVMHIYRECVRRIVYRNIATTPTMVW